MFPWHKFIERDHRKFKCLCQINLQMDRVSFYWTVHTASTSLTPEYQFFPCCSIWYEKKKFLFAYCVFNWLSAFLPCELLVYGLSPFFHQDHRINNPSTTLFISRSLWVNTDQTGGPDDMWAPQQNQVSEPWWPHWGPGSLGGSRQAA